VVLIDWTSPTGKKPGTDGMFIGFFEMMWVGRISTYQNGKTTTYTYDDADRPTALTDPANNTTQYNYDTEDNLLSIIDANGHTTQFAYNARGCSVVSR
jgi:YD repeat-containing protein